MNKIRFYEKKKEEGKERNDKKAKRENFYESLVNGYFFSTNLN